jgi:hypothetical protein
MKIKKVIEQLEKLDPDAMLYFGDGGLVGFDSLPGYYDGDYSYIDEETDKLVFTRTGGKVIPYTRNIDYYIDHYDNDYEKILEENIILDSSLGDDKIQKIKERIKKECDEAKERAVYFYRMFLAQILRKYKDNKIIIRFPKDIQTQPFWTNTETLKSELISLPKISKEMVVELHNEGKTSPMEQGEISVLLKNEFFRMERFNSIEVYFLFNQQPLF